MGVTIFGFESITKSYEANMKKSNGLRTSKQKQKSISPLYEESSFKLVSTLLTEALGRNSQRVFISAKSGNFIYDHAAKVESTETTHFSIKSANVIEKERVTEIAIDGSIKKRNKICNKFSIFFTMKRQCLVIPKPYNKIDNTPKTIESTRVADIIGMLHNSIFTLSLNCIDKAGSQYPLGTGRGYLIFDEEECE